MEKNTKVNSSSDLFIFKYISLIKIITFFYFCDVYSKGYFSIPITPILDIFLIFVFCHVVTQPFLKSDIKRLLCILFSTLALLLKLNHGITLNTFSLIFTSRMPLMIFVTIFLAMYYVRLQTNLEMLTNFFEKVISILVIFIILDGIYINYIGSIQHFLTLFGKVGYTNITNPVFFEFVANGLVPGAQHASIISCAGIILFFPYKKMKLWTFIMFSFSILGLAFTITNTAIISFLVAIIVMFFLHFRFNLKSFFYSIGLLAIILLIVNFFQYWLSIRYIGVLGGADEQAIYIFLERTFEIFFAPLATILSLPLYAILTGIGHSGFEPVNNLLVNKYSLGFFAADFGYLMMVLKHGLINVMIFAVSSLVFVLYVKKNLKYVLNIRLRRNIIRNTGIVSLFIMSAFHYTTLTKSGILQIIILIAVTTVIMIQKRKHSEDHTYKPNLKPKK